MHKKVLVTGAAGYIGKAVCSVFAADGWQLGAIDLLDSPNICIAEEKCDLSEPLGTKQSVDAIAQKLGGIDSIVCCAGQMMSNDGAIGVVTSEIFQKTLTSNVLGTFNAINAVLPYLRNSDYPSITVVGSLVASFGSASSELAYTTSKGAVEAMVKEMAVSLAHGGIRVNCVSPGPLAGGLFPTYPDSIGEKYRLNRIPLGSRGTSDDAAYACLYLASRQASYITGAVLKVDGGASAAFLARNPEEE
ncbi:SDR family NAD(P)-dependent oxidoreductase [Mucilaginibacter psychrotolerans]|uniref:SDR family oxidoreductase n=1 Tax=Mucilaginibacter psychrotolerans TaxID=1524096 RepID=A0A4Y8SC47_9SPHI|nr:SDR family oxidoreductase [Mucilaginibacter psychrotolerans]TFF36195.1 SDR family oxidoreductase [Mucilaginibacter psychrotolerans]